MRDHPNSEDSLNQFDCSNLKIAIVQSVYHSEITNSLRDGAIEILTQHKVSNISHIEMPGAYELVYGCMKSIQIIDGLDGIITLGCVIKGDTDHDKYINHAVATGLIALETKYNLPIGFGLLTPNTLEQARERSGGKHGNKGAETAQAVLQSLSFQVYQL